MYPLSYIEPVFRPPSEWKSLILQVTNGCSWNMCTFCDMYTAENKKFKPKKIEEIEHVKRNYSVYCVELYESYYCTPEALERC